MAAGKNAAAALLEKKGFACVDFDSLVHTAITDCTPRILETFTPIAAAQRITLQNPDGTLNRRALGAVIFKDKTLVARQESIVFPKVIELAYAFMESHKAQNIGFNATVLFKIPELMKKCSAIIFVTSPLIKRLLRAKKRDALPLKNILARFNTQKTLLEDYKKTGIPISKVNNSSTLKNLEKQLEKAVFLLKIS